jgi:hypothetical protein
LSDSSNTSGLLGPVIEPRVRQHGFRPAQIGKLGYADEIRNGLFGVCSEFRYLYYEGPVSDSAVV